MRKCREWKASRWMRPYLFDVVQYFISQLLCRVKHKVVGVHVLEAYWGSGAIVPLSLITSELDGEFILRSFPLGESYFSVHSLDLLFSATFVQQMRNVC